MGTVADLLTHSDTVCSSVSDSVGCAPGKHVQALLVAEGRRALTLHIHCLGTLLSEVGRN